MTQRYLWLLAVLFLFPINKAHALVDMKTANYAQSWTDIDVPSAANQFKMRVERTYNSRSLFDGMFGFGWCSTFETKLEITPEGSLRLIECGSGQETAYLPYESNRKDIDKTIAAIAAKLKDAKQLDDKAIKTLSEDLVTNHNLRSRYATDFKIKVEPKEGLEYMANGAEIDRIVFAKGIFTRTLVGGNQMRFNRDGRLTHIYDNSQNFLKFEYEKDLIKEVVDNNGRKLSFKYMRDNRKVQQITGPGGAQAEYRYSGIVDLQSVTNQWKNTTAYEYDDQHNMTKIIHPDKTASQLGYNKDKDWVTKFVDRDNCTEEYTYELSKDDPRLHYWSTVKKTCGKEVTNESKHEFIQKKRSDGQIYMQRVVSTVNGNPTEIIYHESFGKPVSIRRSGETTTFDYFPNGLVKAKANRQARLTFKYDNRTSKVSEVTTIILNEKGKAAATKRTTFTYDKRGNLSFAANSDGQRVNMTYDDRGRIKTITDQAKKMVKIDYDERFGKPSVVARPGLGTIRVNYKSSGEIEKVISAEGPTVATQVASIFNNLLDILSPASPEVYN